MDKNIENNVNNGGVSMDFVESLIRSAMQRSGVPLRAPNSDETPDVPAPGDIPTSQQKVLFKGIKQVSLAQYESYTEEERKHYMFFVRETNEDNFGFIALGNLKYTIVPEDIRGLDVGYFPECSGVTPEDDCYLPDNSNWSTGITPSQAFFSLYAKSDGYINVNLFGNLPYSTDKLYYHYSSGQTAVDDLSDFSNWVEFPNEETSVQIPVTTGQIVEIVGDLNYRNGESYSQLDHIINFSGTTCSFSVFGNAFSLYDSCCDWDSYYGEVYSGQISLRELFRNCETLTCAIDLVLPGTDMVFWHCYDSMFENCTNLLYGPALPATNANVLSYYRMFAGCTKLLEAPEIMLENIPTQCCEQMFEDCTSLQYVPDFHVTGSVEYEGFSAMFHSCSSLVNAPNIPALSGGFQESSCMDMFNECTSLMTGPSELRSSDDYYTNCFNGMFRDCPNLVTAPELPVMCVGELSCGGMFENCTSLEIAPDLPATDLNDNCYEHMFAGCTNLVNAPDLPATDLRYYCYQYMFAGCTSLVNAPDISAEYVEDESCKYMFSGCTSLAATPDLHFQRIGVSGCEGMFKDCTSLVTINEFPTNTVDLDYFDELGYAEMFAGCTSLVNGLEDVEFVSRDQGYVGMFSGCTSLTAVTGSLNVDGNWDTYKQMFKGCTSLVVVPSLDSEHIDDNCYEEMFMNCTSLVTAPELPSNYASSGCYKRMFYGCSSLNNIVCFLTDFNGYDDCTEDWVHGVAASGTFGRVSDGVDWPTGDSGIPNGWTVIDV